MSESGQVLGFSCGEERLVGILHLPAQFAQRGVLIVTGGPQYRVGSHRQFVLLARHLVRHGVAALRFDYRGMGDSEGVARPYHQINDDLEAAIAAFFAAQPAMRQLVLWGLCDGATAAALHASRDPRIAGLILLNPWVHDEQLHAQTLRQHYYPRRLLQADWWRRLLTGKIALGARLRSILSGPDRPPDPQHLQQVQHPQHPQHPQRTPEQMLYDGLSAFHGRVLVILAGADLGAQQFSLLARSRKHWQRLLATRSIEVRTIAAANHTFASQRWRSAVENQCMDWLRSW